MALLKLKTKNAFGDIAAKLASGRFSASQAGADAAQCLQEAITPKVGAWIVYLLDLSTLDHSPHISRMQVMEDLVYDGFAIVDNVFGGTLSQTLLDEIKVSSEQSPQSKQHLISSNGNVTPCEET